jgi:hypothetical protein
MSEPTLLYALSTLAQTCAALAALVGAVGIYRLSLLHGERHAVYEDIWVQLGRPGLTREQVLQRARQQATQTPPIAENLAIFDASPNRLCRAVIALALFELWQLGSILFALSAFYYVSPPSERVVAIFVVAAVGAVVTSYAAILVWTTG